MHIKSMSSILKLSNQTKIYKIEMNIYSLITKKFSRFKIDINNYIQLLFYILYIKLANKEKWQ